MASSTTKWYRGKVKGVFSGDCLVIVALKSSKPGPLPEKTITLSAVIAPRLARRGGVDEPFAWESREFLRKLCIGKEVTFKVDYNVSSINRDFGTVVLGDKNVGVLVLSAGWGKVREQGQQKGEMSPNLAELLRLEEQAKQEGVGRWSKEPGAAEASIRRLPPPAIGDSSNFDAMALLSANKGRPLEGIVEHVRDGSTLRVSLLPEFQFVQVFVVGIQAPQMGRRAAPESVVEPKVTTDETKTVVDPFGLEAKFFTEMRVLNRDVRIVLEGADKFNNLIGSVYYSDGESASAKDLALELVENGLAKYVEWSANMMEEEEKQKLKIAELQAKKTRLRIWENYVEPATDSKAIHDQNFTGKVVEVVSGNCVIVSDDSIPYGSPLAERRVNLSSIKCPKMGNPRRNEQPAPYGHEAREFLRTRLLGRQVNVQMEYSRKFGPTNGSAVPSSALEARELEFGSVFVQSAPSVGSLQTGVNVGELVVARGFGTVIRHRNFEERSNYYDALLAAESRATSGKKGIHSAKDPPVMHITDLTIASAKKAKDFLPFLHQSRKIPAIVEYVLSGHRFKLFIPKETCNIAFAFSGVRCPGRDEPYSDEAMALMRRKIMQRDVEIEVVAVDRIGTFLGSLWESGNNVAITLLEAGLAKLNTSFGSDRISDFQLLQQAEESAKRQKLKIWENYVEGEAVPNGATVENKQQQVPKVTITEVLGGGKFYIHPIGDQKIESIQQQLSHLNLEEAPLLGAFSPKKGDLVLCLFVADKSWYRAMIVNGPQGQVESPNDKFEVFYIDYGNQEEVTYSQLRPLDPPVSSAPGLAQLCSLAFVKVPNLEEEYGHEAAEYLSELTLKSGKEFRAKVEGRDTSAGKLKGQGTGTVLAVTLVPVDSDISVNAAMLQEGLAWVEKRNRWDKKERQVALDVLEKFQEDAKKARHGIWQYGDVDSDDEKTTSPVRKAGGGGGRR